jgi:hypothetical protein
MSLTKRVLVTVSCRLLKEVGSQFTRRIFVAFYESAQKIFLLWDTIQVTTQPGTGYGARDDLNVTLSRTSAASIVCDFRVGLRKCVASLIGSEV